MSPYPDAAEAALRTPGLPAEPPDPIRRARRGRAPDQRASAAWAAVGHGSRGGPAAPSAAGARAPQCGVVPSFAPIRPRGSRRPLWWLLRRRRPVAGVLALLAALVSLLLPHAGAEPASPPDPLVSGGSPAAQEADDEPQAAAAEPRQLSLTLPIADPASVRSLTPGDRVDVFATAPSGGGAEGGSSGVPEARLVASGARVAEVPEPPGGAAEERGTALSSGVEPDGLGARLVLSVAPDTAAELAGAAAGSTLAVARW
ncbi:RcpC/CpaB family pilus assembly protein [Streptomyces profundus]|uniref:RcpC/CpaB family pilus assembly protein n=1 Tax=Streptomyces profundus TaxID=2867410 RepID=UPI001D16907E|nr:RcpC/CpaB family pilus assembly protein [Streptomyces sp. MA3_2.13]UED85817.1 hypothetical protein K4G22_17780 [Streptomyces sp. MA3_2.13]